jgi:hypothetical protein
VKAALVASHSLTPYQKVDKLMAMKPLSGRKLSEMLAAMQKLRPPKDFFTHAFLERLAREIIEFCWLTTTSQTYRSWRSRPTSRTFHCISRSTMLLDTHCMKKNKIK